MKSVNLSFIVIILLFTSLFSFGQETKLEKQVDAVKYYDENKRWYNNFTEHWFYFSDISDEDIRDSIVHWERIGLDFKNQLDNGAGTYSNGGETHGDFIRWSLKSGFIWLNVNKCQGGPMKIIRGRVELVDSKITFITEKMLGGNHLHGGHGSHKKENSRMYLVVAWNGSHYLVHPKQARDFGLYAAGLGKHNSEFLYSFDNTFFYKIENASSDPSTELPVFPREYSKFARKPIKAKITAVLGTYTRVIKHTDDLVELETTVRLDGGTSAGLYRGFNLSYKYDDPILNYHESITVVKAAKNYSIAVVSRETPSQKCKITSNQDCKIKPYVPLTKGLQLSSARY